MEGLARATLCILITAITPPLLSLQPSLEVETDIVVGSGAMDLSDQNKKSIGKS